MSLYRTIRKCLCPDDPCCAPVRDLSAEWQELTAIGRLCMEAVNNVQR